LSISHKLFWKNWFSRRYAEVSWQPVWADKAKSPNHSNEV